ncbi:MAG: NTP transferase domain-containing protein [Ruminococcus sp.]|nr:NTP transferase domain-containing protein [Ruminococcus sp.]
MSNCAIILAGGEGKRMKSDKPKTLSEVLGKPMLWWVMSALKKAGIDDICVVKGFRKECIEEYLSTLDFEVESVFQAERLGTGHAVMMAKDFLASHDGNVVILNGDAPFMTAETIEKSLEQHLASGAAATVISARVDDPTGYGRIVRDDSGNLKAIVEHKDADEATRAIDEVNSGGYWFDCQLLLSVLDRIKSDNAAGEYYLPDAIALLLSDGKTVGAYTAECSDAVLGANDPAQLEELNQIAREKGYSC